MPPSSTVASLPADNLPDYSEDLQLELAARLALRGRCERSVRGLAIHVDGRVLTLYGRTRSFYEKQLLLHAVQRVSNLAGIVDEIAVSDDSE